MLPPGDSRHGTVYGYHVGKCRCEECREAWRADYRTKKRAALADPEASYHGKKLTYERWGCRCEPCTAAYERAEAFANSRAEAEELRAQEHICDPRNGKVICGPCIDAFSAWLHKIAPGAFA